MAVDEVGSRGRRGPSLWGVVWIAAASACGPGRASKAPLDADGIVASAIRGSSEGVIVLPSHKAESAFADARLHEIAEALRRPAAHCFVQRAIETMEPDPEVPHGFLGIPDGQLKLRARIAPTGTVALAEILEDGFADPVVSQCFADIVRKRRWPEHADGHTHAIDVVYWVSLGAQAPPPASSDARRRQAAEIARRGKACVAGRLEPGDYRFEGLNLIGNDGKSVASRVDDRSPANASVPDEVSQCLARAFRELRLDPDPEAFLRPVALHVGYTVGEDAVVEASDEAWLRLVELEDAARRAERRAELGAPATEDGASRTEAPPGGPSTAIASGGAPGERGVETGGRTDPGRPGLKLDLSSGRGSEAP